MLRKFAPDLDAADCRLIVARMASDGHLDMGALTLQDVRNFFRGIVFDLSHQDVRLPFLHGLMGALQL